MADIRSIEHPGLTLCEKSTLSLPSVRRLGCQDSNLGSWFQRPLPYRLATPEGLTKRDQEGFQSPQSGLSKFVSLYRTPCIVHDEGVFVNIKTGISTFMGLVEGVAAQIPN